jgi:uncharacterized membrane protein YphA (DoxX/SURF4 family)
MLNEVVAKSTLAPLILRLALAVIFIYHGWVKVSEPGSEWGAAWAVSAREREEKMPDDVKRRIENLPNETTEKKHQVEDALATAYLEESRNRQHPAALTFFGVQFLVAWGELLGGAAMLLGFLTRWAALGLVIIQIGAIATVTYGKGFSAGGGAGYEYNVALIGMCLALMLTGGGRLSVDQLLFARRRAPAQQPAPPPAMPPAQQPAAPAAV